MNQSSTTACLIAACYRSPYLTLAVIRETDVLEVLRHRVDGANHRAARLRQLVETAAAEYDAATAIVEPGTALEAALHGRHLTLRRLSLAEAKTQLLDHTTGRSHRDLCQHLVSLYPRLCRFVRILPLTGRVAMTESWRTAMLLPIALGLAAARTADVERPLASGDEVRTATR